VEDLGGGRMDSEEAFEHYSSMQAFNKFYNLTGTHYGTKEEIEEFMVSKDSGRMTNEELLRTRYKMDIMPKSEFTHAAMSECTGSEHEVEFVLKIDEVNWGVRQRMFQSEKRCNIPKMQGCETKEDYVNLIMDKVKVSREDAIAIYDANEEKIRTNASGKAFMMREKKLKARKRNQVCEVYKKRIKRHQLEYPFRVHKEANEVEAMRKQEVYRVQLENKKKKREYLGKALGIPEGAREKMVFEEKPELNNQLALTDHSAEMERALIPNKNVVLSNRFTNFVRQKYREFVNPFLEQHGYHISSSYKLIEIGYCFQGLPYLIENLRHLAYNGGGTKPFDYDTLMEMYLEEHGGEKNPLSNLFDRCLKHFNQTILKRIRNRRNYSRIVLLSDEDKAKLIVGLACKEYGLMKPLKDKKQLRATELRKICSQFYR
jgi:NACalpha-BTF3-like transcription factor